MDPKKNHNSEFEVKLVVVSQRPMEIARSLKRLTKLGNFLLTNRRILNIRDSYFDTRTADLRKNQLALRVRLVENKKLLTLKGKATIAGWGGIKRLEIEEEWSTASLQKVMKKIPGLRYGSNDLNNLFSLDNPTKTLKNLSFGIVQDRITQRELKNVVSREKSIPLAEFAVDEVRFQTPAGKIIHYEVEIEAREESAIESVHKILKEVQSHYPDDLQIWVYSKFETGEVINRNASELKINSFINKDNSISKKGYEMIANLLHKVKD